MTETDLIRNARLGDRDAFAGLVSSHEKKLLALCWNMLGERDEARDAAQEALLQAFENFARFDPERSFIKWLLGIGAKRCLDRLRQRRKFLGYFVDRARERVWPAVDPPFATEGRTGRLLQQLSARERAVISLAVFEDFSAREIAATLGLSLIHI